MRKEGPPTEEVTDGSSEPQGRASLPPVHALVRDRFDIGRCLGSGTFGAVYEARDRGSGAIVALKKLGISDAGAIYSFKQEFRALADVVHPNLVRLDELFSVDDELYLVMELVDGENFLAWVRPQAEQERAAAPTADLSTQSFADAPSSVAPSSALRWAGAGVLTVDRLRPALCQLALGVHAVHREGKLHRDLKPSNVLVTAAGRVVLLDFGLVAAPGPRRERRVVGTPAYMSPEQAQGHPLGPASDWYAVGVMLFEALTGDLPIEGDVRSILDLKSQVDAPDPRTRAPGLPDDLADLCLSLLARDPRARPSGVAVLRALGIELEADTELDVPPLVGREHHLAALEDAFAATRPSQHLGAAPGQAGLRPQTPDHAVTMLVHGPSGMGKSALCRAFLARLVEEQSALVLMGRCHERELMPFKALDPIIDALADLLGTMPADDVAAMLPADTPALARLFPVLRRVPAVAAAAKAADPPDPHELRRLAGLALRDLLSGVAHRAPLVVMIDDLQWGDADSASLFLDLLAPPDPPPMLFLAGYRSEDTQAIHLATALRRQMARGEPVGDVRELLVGPLAPFEARALARALLGATSELGEDPDEIAAIARESDGAPISLRNVVVQRIERLPEDARQALAVLAVAGQPIRASSVERAAGIDGAAAFSVLRAQSMVVSRGAGAQRALEPFHGRIREAVLARLSREQVAELSLALARALEAEGADPEALMVYYEAGGDAVRARDFAQASADRADAALAFDRAAALYRRALDGAPEPRPLLVKLARALACAGRGVEAGRAYLDAVEGAPPDEELELRRCAAEQFLRAGHVDEGLGAMRGVLAAVGLSLPETPTRAFASLLYRRARLSLRGLDFEERPGAATQADLARIDACWSVGNGLTGVDIVRSADFQARHLLYALDAGEPYRAARALANESAFASMEGGKGGAERAERLLARAAEIAERIAHPHALAWTASGRAAAAYYTYRYREAIALADEAVARFRASGGDIVWELGALLCWFVLPGLWFLGDIDEIGRRLPACLKEAEDLGALYNLTSLRTLTLPRLLLAQDRPWEARRESTDAVSRWSKRHGWTAQHTCDMYTRAHSALYAGDGPAAFAEVDASFPEVDRSLLLRVEAVRIDCLYLRGSSAVAAAHPSNDGARLLRIAEKDARALGREERSYAHAFSRALHAAVALERGQLDKAAALYGEAVTLFDGLQMDLYAAAMRRRRGEIVLGEEGRDLMEDADRLMSERGVARPDRMTAMLAPARE